MARICHLSHVEVTFNFMAPLIRALVEEGHDVTVACSMDAGGTHLRHYLGIVAITYDEVKVARRITPSALTIDILALARYLRGKRFDVLHVHGPLPALQARVAAWIAGTNTVIYHAHGFYFHDGMNRVVRLLAQTVEFVWCRLFTDYLITLNTEDHRSAVEGRYLSDVSRILYVPGVGVDTDRFRPATRVSVLRQELAAEGICATDEVAITFVGRIVREKGVCELLEAFARTREIHSNAVLLMLGETLASERDQSAGAWLEAFVDRHGLKKCVKVLGRRYDVERFLQASDMFVLPSYREGMPVSLMEAMACGLACIATDVRGCRDAIRDGDTGLLVPPRDSHLLSIAMMRLLGDPAFASRMGSRAREVAQDKFSVDQIVAAEVSLYGHILGNREVGA